MSIIISWNTFHSREHVYRALLAGNACEQRLVGEGVRAATGQPFTEYNTLSSGSRTRLWRQVMADVTSIPITRSTTIGATFLGAGILAAVAVGWYTDAYQAAAAMTDTAKRFTPNPEPQQFYDRLYQHCSFTLQTLLHRLSELTRHD